MRKIFTIAGREYRAMVGTKAFLISILIMPVLMFGGLAAMTALRNVGDVKERKIVVFSNDQNQELFETLSKKALEHNELIRKSPKASSDQNNDDNPFGQSREIFLLERSSTPIDDATRALMSDKIRTNEIYAFVELPDGLTRNPDGKPKKILFYSQDSSLAEARAWLMREVNAIVRAERLGQSFDEQQIAKIKEAQTPIGVSGMSLVERQADGKIKSAEEKNELVDILLPMGFMMLMFMVIFMAAQPMLETVLEEKSQRIAEVLLGSVNPTQLMMGKLLGTVGGSLTIFMIYMGGTYFMAQQRGWTDNIPMHLLPWFLAFQILGVLFFSAIFMAVGASVSQLKEAQSLLLPVWMVMMLPMFVWLLIVRDPLGPLAKWMSFFPPATSTTMILRLATNQTIPLWELITALVLLVVSTFLIIIIAGRIFRVGILWQGKVPKIQEILRWALTG